VPQRERGREKERKKERQKERKREREKGREREREREIEREWVSVKKIDKWRKKDTKTINIFERKLVSKMVFILSPKDSVYGLAPVAQW
jgi:hypothetical protein